MDFGKFRKNSLKAALGLSLLAGGSQELYAQHKTQESTISTVIEYAKEAFTPSYHKKATPAKPAAPKHIAPKPVVKQDFMIYPVSRDCKEPRTIHESFYGKLDSLELIVQGQKIPGVISGHNVTYTLPSTIENIDSQLYGRVIGYSNKKQVTSSGVTIKGCKAEPVYAPAAPAAPSKTAAPVDLTQETNQLILNVTGRDGKEYSETFNYSSGDPNAITSNITTNSDDSDKQTAKSEIRLKNVPPGTPIKTSQKVNQKIVNVPMAEIMPKQETPKIAPKPEEPSDCTPYTALTLQFGRVTDTFSATETDSSGKSTTFPSSQFAGTQVGIEVGHFDKNYIFKANFANTTGKDSTASDNAYNLCPVEHIEGISFAVDYTGKIPITKKGKLGVFIGGGFEAKNIKTFYGNDYDSSFTTSTNRNTITTVKTGLAFGKSYACDYLNIGVAGYRQTIDEAYPLDASPNSAASHVELGYGLYAEGKCRLPDSKLYLEGRVQTGNFKTESSTNGKYLKSADFLKGKALIGYSFNNHVDLGFGIATAQNGEEWASSIDKSHASTKHSGSKFFFQGAYRW